MRNKLRFIYTVVVVVLLLMLYFIIFSFSAQDGETSGSFSLTISRMGVKLWNGLIGGDWSAHIIEQLASYFENPIRKFAHFMEYGVMGFLVHSLWMCWGRASRWWILYSVIWVFLSAAADEVHQYFVPGRSGNIPDVFLDTCGGLTGVFLCIFLFRLMKRVCKK